MSKGSLKGRKFKYKDLKDFCNICNEDKDWIIVDVKHYTTTPDGTYLCTSIEPTCGCVSVDTLYLRLDSIVWLDSVKKLFSPFKNWKPKHVKTN
jgi:hypothetical protein